MKFVRLLLLVGLFLFATTNTVYAVEDPLSVPNNKFGIHIINPTLQEAEEAASLVNANGGKWGYIAFVIQADDRDSGKWQTFFDNLRRLHLTPIVRIATNPVGGYWRVPETTEAKAWASFLNELNWPVKNRYVVIYNEPNHATEWGNRADPASYAKTLNETIDALKAASPDFFVMNAGFDASAPQQPPAYYNEQTYLEEMNRAVPGIFDRLDGWSSHSYPNPDFSGSPLAAGRGTVRTYQWELSFLRNLGVSKQLPVFITETGWKHSGSYASPETVGEYMKNAFQGAWNSDQIVAVTPFILNYPQAPFSQFSFKKPSGDVLGRTYYPHFDAIESLSKESGRPRQVKIAEKLSGELPSAIVAGEPYTFHFVFRNGGQSIWNEGSLVQVRPVSGVQGVTLTQGSTLTESPVEPGKDQKFSVEIMAPSEGTYEVKLNLFEDDQQFDNEPLVYSIEAKPAVKVVVKSGLQWKDDFAGDYTLTLTNKEQNLEKTIILNETGTSELTQIQRLLPDQEYEITIQKPFYQPKTIKQTLRSKENTLDLGTLTPDILSVLLNPRQLWKLLPFS